MYSYRLLFFYYYMEKKNRVRLTLADGILVAALVPMIAMVVAAYRTQHSQNLQNGGANVIQNTTNTSIKRTEKGAEITINGTTYSVTGDVTGSGAANGSTYVCVDGKPKYFDAQGEKLGLPGVNVSCKKKGGNVSYDY